MPKIKEEEIIICVTKDKFRVINNSENLDQMMGALALLMHHAFSAAERFSKDKPNPIRYSKFRDTAVSMANAYNHIENGLTPEEAFRVEGLDKDGYVRIEEIENL